MADDPSQADYIDFFVDHILIAALIAARRNQQQLSNVERLAFEEAKRNAAGALELLFLPSLPDKHPISTKLRKSK